MGIYKSVFIPGYTGQFKEKLMPVVKDGAAEKNL